MGTPLPWSCRNVSSEPPAPNRKPATSPGTSCFRATQKALWEGIREGTGLGCPPASGAHLPTSYPSLLCKDGTVARLLQFLYLGMAAGFKCVSGLWQRSRRIVKQILPEPSKPGEGTGGIGRVRGPWASISSVFHQSGPGSLLAWVSRRPMGPLALSPFSPARTRPDPGGPRCRLSRAPCRHRGDFPSDSHGRPDAARSPKPRI